MTNLFKDYRNYRSRLVDSPSYKWLQQEVVDEKELKKMKQREYQRKYYQEHKEKYREYASRSWRKYHPPKWDRWLMWMQLAIYNYLVEKTREWVDAPRWTQIARDLGITCAQVYNAVFVLVKKGYVWRYMSWRYYLTKVPEEKDTITASDLDRTYKKLYNKSKEEEKIFMTTEEDYNNLVKTNEELKKELQECRKEKEELEWQVKNSVDHIEWLMESNNTLEKKNLSLRGQVDELKGVVKVLLKYFQ